MDDGQWTTNHGNQRRKIENVSEIIIIIHNIFNIMGVGHFYGMDRTNAGYSHNSSSLSLPGQTILFAITDFTSFVRPSVHLQPALEPKCFISFGLVFFYFLFPRSHSPNFIFNDDYGFTCIHFFFC